MRLRRRLCRGLKATAGVRALKAGLKERESPLAQVASPQREPAERQDAPHEHRQRLCAGEEALGVLGAGDERLEGGGEVDFLLAD